MRSYYLALVVGLFLAAPSWAQDKVALVIGNGNYKRAGWELRNPTHDAELVADTLVELGFDVQLELDLTQADMMRAFKEYSQRLAAAGPDATGLFYFAGHGVESGGHNFLIPVDARPETEEDVWYEAPRLGLLLRGVHRAGNAVNFIILDACRNNPLPSASRSVAGGLAAPKRQSGQLFAYATEPGQTASDGKIFGNGPYSRALSTWLLEPGLVAETVFKRVADQVHNETDGIQTPFFNSGLIGRDIYLAGQKTPPTDDEMTAFKAATSACDYAAFATAYPTSALSTVAASLGAQCVVAGEPDADGEDDGEADAFFATTAPTYDRIGADFVFGIDDPDLTGDEVCSDRRFTGPLMAAAPWRASDIGKDATDCQEAWDVGGLLLRTQESLGIGNIPQVYKGIDFGSDEGSLANDGLCNDAQFKGASMAPESQRMDAHIDRSDCLVAFLAGGVKLHVTNGL